MILIIFNILQRKDTTFPHNSNTP
jgi:hypothetical protein